MTHLLTDHSVIRETKSTLARLLATENLTVEHRADIETAMFNPKTRTLLLPVFENMSGPLYDLFVGHEVGHALFTPEDGFHHKDCKEGPNFRSILNVTEDARIEKRVKRKFPGLRRDFVEGYTDLIDRDFFGIKNRDLSTLNLIDKINIRTKTCGAVDIPFDVDEKVFLDRAFALETFDEAVALANDLYDHCADAADTDHGHGEQSDEGEWVEVDPEDVPEGAEVRESTETIMPNEGDDVTPKDGNPTDDGDDSEDSEDEGDGSSSSDEEGDDEGEEESESSGSSESEDGEGEDDSSESEEDDESSNGNALTDGAGSKKDDNEINSDNPFSETDRNFRNREKELVNSNAGEYTYVTVPSDVKLDGIIRPFKKVHAQLTEARNNYANSRRGGLPGDAISTSLNTFIKSAKKTVAYLAKEFEMKKAADEYARSSTGRTGVVDVNKLHSYKYNEDLFKRVTTVPTGKNHGLVMFIDLSGSMSENMGSTIEQLICLTLFCKKVNIPFDVYGFNDNRSNTENVDSNGNIIPHAEYRRGELILSNSFYLRHYFSSEMRATEFKTAVLNMWFMKLQHDRGGYYNRSLPLEDQLGSTPLNDTIIVANQIVEAFREKTRVQVVNVVFLTDGESNSLNNASDGNGGEIRTRYSGNVILTDKKSRKNYPFHGWNEQTDILLNVLKSNSEVNIAGFFLIPKRRARREIQSIFRNDYPADNDVKFAKFKKDGVLIVEDRGYDEYYIIPGGSDLSAVDSYDPLEDLSDDASKAKIRSAFKKSTGGRVKNKVVLTKFIDLITS